MKFSGKVGSVELWTIFQDSENERGVCQKSGASGSGHREDEGGSSKGQMGKYMRSDYYNILLY